MTSSTREPLLSGPPSPASSAGSARAHAVHHYGFWAGVCLTLNTCIGVGILALPKAFNDAGIAFSAVTMLVASVFITLGTTWVVESSSRAVGWAAAVFADETQGHHVLAAGETEEEARTHVRRLREVVAQPPELVHDLLAAYEGAPGTPAIEHHHPTSGTGGAGGADDGKPLSVRGPDPEAAPPSSGGTPRVTTDWREPRMDKAFSDVGGRLFELNELMDVFCPRAATVAYEVAVLSMLFMALWSFTSVFGNSMISKFPLFHSDWGHDCTDDFDTACAWSFRAFVLILGVIAIYLTLAELSEQLSFQIFLTIMRFLLIVIIVLTSAFGVAYNGVDNESAHESAPFWGSYRTWNWGGIVGIIATTFFSQLVDFSMPAILTSLRDKSRSGRLVAVALTLTNTLYLFVGISGAVYYGDALKSQINLNYADYSFGHRDSTPWYAYPLQYFVTLFPALDTLSLFPLIAVPMGNSIRGILMRVSPGARRASPARVKAVSRLVAAVPPLFCALVERDLSTIIHYASLPALWIAFVAPITLQYYSRRAAIRHGVSPDTPFSVGALSRTPGLVVTTLFCALCYFFQIGGLIDKDFAADLGI